MIDFTGKTQHLGWQCKEEFYAVAAVVAWYTSLEMSELYRPTLDPTMYSTESIPEACPTSYTLRSIKDKLNRLLTNSATDRHQFSDAHNEAYTQCTEHKSHFSRFWWKPATGC